MVVPWVTRVRVALPPFAASVPTSQVWLPESKVPFDAAAEAIGSGKADRAKAAVEAGRFTVSSVETKPFAKNPPPPFTTSTLQQEAARKLGFAASHTMRVAQGLYEQGLITYMRTDGVDMAPEAISAARRTIAERYDAGYVPDRPRQYQSKVKNAQEAHEAIRPTDFAQRRAGSGDHARLYELVYNRALASQMASARLERTTVELSDGAGKAVLRATGQVVLFPGFLALYEEGIRLVRLAEESIRTAELRIERVVSIAVLVRYPAERAGIQLGDVIVRLNDQPIRSDVELTAGAPLAQALGGLARELVVRRMNLSGLSKEEIATVQKWIATGAKLDAGLEPGAPLITIMPKLPQPAPVFPRYVEPEAAAAS